MKFAKFFLSVVTIGVSLLATNAQVVITWNFGTSSANTSNSGGTPSNFTVGAVSVGNSFGTLPTNPNSTSASSGYTGASGQFNMGQAGTTNAFSTSTSPYFQVTVTPSAGYAINLSDFDFGVRSTSTGAKNYSLRWDIDSYANEITGGTIANNSTWSLKDNTFSSVGGGVDTAITFRLYVSGNTGNPSSGTITTRIDDLTITLLAVPEPSAYALFASLGLIGFGVWRRVRR